MMFVDFRGRPRHPLFPGVSPHPAVGAKGAHAALIGTIDELLQAAPKARARRAVFVTRGAGNPFLSEYDRDRLWDLYEVPILILLMGENGKILAYECEAQNGLHVDGSPPDGAVETAPCACGRPGVRLAPWPQTAAPKSA